MLIELVTNWETGFGTCKWILWKNVVIGIFGVGALFFGSKSAIIDIMKVYSTPENGT